jgi:hypothetical protein
MFFKLYFSCFNVIKRYQPSKYPRFKWTWAAENKVKWEHLRHQLALLSNGFIYFYSTRESAKKVKGWVLIKKTTAVEDAVTIGGHLGSLHLDEVVEVATIG